MRVATLLLLIFAAATVTGKELYHEDRDGRIFRQEIKGFSKNLEEQKEHEQVASDSFFTVLKSAVSEVMPAVRQIAFTIRKSSKQSDVDHQEFVQDIENFVEKSSRALQALSRRVEIPILSNFFNWMKNFLMNLGINSLSNLNSMFHVFQLIMALTGFIF